MKYDDKTGPHSVASDAEIVFLRQEIKNILKKYVGVASNKAIRQSVETDLNNCVAVWAERGILMARGVKFRVIKDSINPTELYVEPKTQEAHDFLLRSEEIKSKLYGIARSMF